MAMENKTYQGWTILVDCDGTLTDGKKYVNAKGERESIAFHSRDSVACRELVEMGFQVLVVSDSSFIGIYEYWKKYGAHCIINATSAAGDKLSAIEMIRSYEGDLQGFDWGKTIGIGDDITDICFLEKVKYPHLVSDCHQSFFIGGDDWLSKKLPSGKLIQHVIGPGGSGVLSEICHNVKKGEYA